MRQHTRLNRSVTDQKVPGSNPEWVAAFDCFASYSLYIFSVKLNGDEYRAIHLYTPLW